MIRVPYHAGYHRHIVTVTYVVVSFPATAPKNRESCSTTDINTVPLSSLGLTLRLNIEVRTYEGPQSTLYTLAETSFSNFPQYSTVLY